MQKKISLALPLVMLMAIGAGCAAEQPTSRSTDNYYNANQQKAPITPPAEAPKAQADAAVAPTPTTPTNPTPEKTMNDTALAFPGILPETETDKLVHLKTTQGDIVFEILPKEGPKAASNFVYLTKKKFYDGLTFHRVVPGFVIQGGDPEGSGMGGPGYKFEDDPVHLPYNAGIVAMANAGPNTNGSQFFIMLEDNSLPPNYSIFGRVKTGMDVVRKISVGDKMLSVTLEDKK